MWRFKPFMPKEPTGLEGRCIDIADIKVQVKNVIAEGGFSCVYLARDAVNASKQYAVKHIICNDEESLELVMKEISVMKLLRGHPNVVTLYSHTILDMGRTKEALLVMEFCEKSLVSVLESRGAGYFLEDQVLLIFRDVCNAVFAMHCQSPPIAHRDLKAENLLLGSDGLWKLCDFGSTSTNHKRFVKPEEMGVEEDVIRKHTTPAYRAPEMWDLFRRDLINEKVDIWALGCLLYRICYFKSAFDGESKLQVLNGNYRIPDAPKYSTAVIDLIRDMLQISPDHRPDVTQVWFRVNQQSPMGQQKSLPDRPPESRQGIPERDEGISKLTVKSVMARRSSPTPTTSINTTQKVSPQNASRSGASEPAGSFWSSPHAEDSILGENNGAPKFDQEIDNYSTSKQDRPRLAQHHLSGKTSPSRDLNQRIGPAESLSKPRDRYSKDSVTRSSQADKLKPDRTANFENEAFNTFVAEFDTSRLNAGVSNNFGKQSLEAEVERLKDQLKQVNVEKSEVTSRYEKLSAICRSQRQEILELKQAVGARFPSPGNSVLRTHSSPIIQASVTSQVDGTAQQGFIGRVSPNPEAKTWQAFSDDPSPLTSTNNDAPQPVRTQKAQPRTQSVPARFGDSKWGFETDSFTATPGSTSRLPKPGEKINFKPSWDSNKGESKQASQPAGWAGF